MFLPNWWLVFRLALVDEGASDLADWCALVVPNRGVSTVLSYRPRVVYFGLCSRLIGFPNWSTKVSIILAEGCFLKQLCLNWSVWVSACLTDRVRISIADPCFSKTSRLVNIGWADLCTCTSRSVIWPSSRFSASAHLPIYTSGRISRVMYRHS
jgi:hypothetical protein